jgi:hypothetical protein
MNSDFLEMFGVILFIAGFLVLAWALWIEHKR